MDRGLNLHEHYVHTPVANDRGRLIGYIVQVWDGGTYVGSFFVQRKQDVNPAHCQNMGLNGARQVMAGL